jgi:hypothetical protein
MWAAGERHWVNKNTLKTPVPILQRPGHLCSPSFPALEHLFKIEPAHLGRELKRKEDASSCFKIPGATFFPEMPPCWQGSECHQAGSGITGLSLWTIGLFRVT